MLSSSSESFDAVRQFVSTYSVFMIACNCAGGVVIFPVDVFFFSSMMMKTTTVMIMRRIMSLSLNIDGFVASGADNFAFRHNRQSGRVIRSMSL